MVQVQRGPASSHPESALPRAQLAGYEAGLRRRGDLTLWIDEAALNKWQAPRRNTPGGLAMYSDLRC